jgi:hypothetical protein
VFEQQDAEFLLCNFRLVLEGRTGRGVELELRLADLEEDASEPRRKPS